MSDLGFAEAFMYGDVECDDLVTLFKVCPCFLIALDGQGLTHFKIFLLNRENLAEMKSPIVGLLFTLPQRLTSIRFLNTLSNSRSNISAHYDISNKYVVLLLCYPHPSCHNLVTALNVLDFVALHLGTCFNLAFAYLQEHGPNANVGSLIIGCSKPFYRMT